MQTGEYDPDADGPLGLEELQRKLAILRFMAGLVSFCAAITSFWAIYLVFRDRGVVGGIAAFVAAATVFRLGPAPLFAVSASVIAFAYHKTGLWLPILSYIVALVTLIIALRLRPRQG